MSDEHVWQKRFRDPAILTCWERSILSKAIRGEITPSEVEAWKGFSSDIAEEIKQLQVDGWVVLNQDKDAYELADDAPEFTLLEL